jgi:hypothetical protein
LSMLTSWLFVVSARSTPTCISVGKRHTLLNYK